MQVNHIFANIYLCFTTEKRLFFRGPKTHENSQKPTNLAYIRRHADEFLRRN